MASTLTVDNIVGAASASTIHIPGHIIQTVTGTHSTQLTTTSTSYITSGITATITPKSSSSKILILSNFQAQVTSQNNQSGYFTVFRGSTNLGNGGQFLRLEVNVDNWFGSQTIQHLDSPNTTSATTYDLQFRSQTSALTTRINLSSNTGYLTLLEIAQ
jgi:hypothetical protein